MTGPDSASFADHMRDPITEAQRTVDPSKWFLPAPLFIACIIIGLPMATWVWNTNMALKRFESLLVKIDRQMVVPSQFTEWGYEFKACNPAANLTVPRLPKKSADQYQGE